jgi:alpha-L-fucosidase
MRKIIYFIASWVLVMSVAAQNDAMQGMAHKKSSSYIYPKEDAVLQTLDRWQDLKFGVLISWGISNELNEKGGIGSWVICGEDYAWINRDRSSNYDDFKRDYKALINKFNPVRYNAEEWAETLKQGGVKYLIMMTKHHDGYCLWDTKYTDFSVAHGTFGNARRDLVKETLNTFRKHNFMVGTYFSKPDWFCPYYWWDYFPTPNRNVNYDVKKYSDRWNKFKEYTYNQIEELVNGSYGDIDILWLDGGWVCPPQQDIEMSKIAGMARRYQPGLLVVDRTVQGEFENYQTPEQEVSNAQLQTPWESCITLGNSWEFLPCDKYKSSAQVIHTLVEIVAKGGNLLLGFGPTKDGDLNEDIAERLKDVGAWLSKNGDAIYGTRCADYYRDGDTWFTQSKDGTNIYAIVCLKEGEPLPAKVRWKGNEPARRSRLKCLQTGKSASWKKLADGNIEVALPSGLPKGTAAVAFELKIN